MRLRPTVTTSLSSKALTECVAGGRECSCFCYPKELMFGACLLQVAQMRADLLAQLNDSMKLLKEERNLTYLALRNMSQYIDKWKKAVKREKAVYHTLNLFEPYMQVRSLFCFCAPARGTACWCVVRQGMLRGQAWVLRDSMTRVNDAIAKAHAHAGERMPPCLCYHTSYLLHSIDARAMVCVAQALARRCRSTWTPCLRSGQRRPRTSTQISSRKCSKAL